MHILGEKLCSSLAVCQIRLAYGTRFSSQTALSYESPDGPNQTTENWSIATYV